MAPAESVQMKSFALTAVAIRRSLDVTLDDVQVALALAMCDEAAGRFRFRTRSHVRLFARRLGSDRDRSLAASLPVFLYDLEATGVHVVTADDARAREDADLYRAINEQHGRASGIGLLEPGEGTTERQAALAENIVVGSLACFDENKPGAGTAVVRAAEGRKAVAGRYARILYLADPT